jgi:hypothetical protein
MLNKIKRKKTKRIVHIVHRNCLLKQDTEEIWNGRDDKLEGVSSYWVFLRKRENTGK